MCSVESRTGIAAIEQKPFWEELSMRSFCIGFLLVFSSAMAWLEGPAFGVSHGVTKGTPSAAFLPLDYGQSRKSWLVALKHREAREQIQKEPELKGNRSMKGVFPFEGVRRLGGDTFEFHLDNESQCYLRLYSPDGTVYAETPSRWRGVGIHRIEVPGTPRAVIPVLIHGATRITR